MPTGLPADRVRRFAPLAALMAAASLDGLGAGGATGPEQAWAQSRAGGAVSVAHVGIVVRDVERSAQAWAALTGADPPAVRTEEADGGEGAVRAARLRLSNVTLELLEPVGDAPGAYRDFLDTRGQGIHHVALRVEGGTLAAALPGGGRIDLTRSLGLAVDVAAPDEQGRLSEPPAPGPVRGAGRLARPTCVTHVGIVVRDVEASRRALADRIGVDPTPIRPFEAATGAAAFSVFNLANVGIELIQQTGGGAYADFLDTYGHRAHHLGLHLRTAGGGLDMAEQVAWFERHGGVMAVDGGGFAYVDLRPRLGLHVEALPDASSDAVYPHPHPHDAPQD